VKRMQIRVRYNDEWHVLTNLCKEKSVDRQLVYDRYIRAGRPGEIDDTFFLPKKENRPFKSRPLFFNGESITPSELAKQYGVSKSTVNKHAAKHDWHLTTENFQIDREATERAAISKKMKETDKINRITGKTPGWWERENLLDVGKNGFTGGKSDGPYPIRVMR
jgi:hypothetical protein